MAKTSAAQIRATNKYRDEHKKRVVMDINITTMADVLQQIESTDSKQGYIVGLIKADLARKHHACLILNGNRIEVKNLAKHESSIAAAADLITAAADRSLLEHCTSLFNEGTPLYIILGEYLRITDKDLEV